MNPTHIMVDLETFGSTPGSAIASIGAVAFDPFTGALGAQFYRLVDPASCVALGLTIDGDTFLWWLKQSDAARSAMIYGKRETLAQALSDFSAFWRFVGGTHFWGHGANFDDPVLAAAYRAHSLRTPWKYTQSRCTRTIFELAGVTPQRAEGVHHNALDDAKVQADAVIAAYQRLHLQPAPDLAPAMEITP